MLIDICVNLLNGQFREDTEAIIARAAAAGVARFVITGTDLDSSRRALEWCTHGRRATAGVHPHDAGDLPADWLEQLHAIASDERVCAVGETGLDFNRNYTPQAAQRAVFDAQIELAQALGRPLFVHDRESNGEVLQRLLAASQRAPLPPVVIHCFTGTADELDAYLEAGFYIGITGWICDERRGDQLRGLVPRIPLERLLLETDAPFLRPHNAPPDFADRHGLSGRHRKRNEPALLPSVLAGVAACRDEPESVIAAATTRNAETLFVLA